MRNHLLVVGFILSSVLTAQQPNHAEGSLVLFGINGPPYPIVLPVNLGILPGPQTLSVEILGSPNSAFTVWYAPAGVEEQGGVAIGGVGILDLTLSGFPIGGGLIPLLDGIGVSGPGVPLFRTQANGAFALQGPVSASAAGFLGGFQTLIQNPTGPLGYSLTAATELSFVNNPGTAIFVAPTGLPTNPGTVTAPLDRIQPAINMAATMPPPVTVYVAVGTYTESQGLSVANGVSIRGGCHPSLWSQLPTLLSVVLLPSTGAVAESITTDILVSRLELRSADAPQSQPVAASSIALSVRNSTSLLRFEDCRFLSGQGGNGLPGPSGSSGSSGASGSGGGAGITIIPGGGGGGASGFQPGGAGGGGGYGGANNGGSGNAAPNGGGSGGSGGNAGGCGNSNSTNMNGNPGATGLNGQAGTAGIPAATSGNISGNAWIPGPSGGNGSGTPTYGLGGGGGGGGGGNQEPAGSLCLLNVPGGGGGGGGSGGGPATPGQGGRAAGASFAVFSFAASPVFVRCHFQTAGGQAGGAAGAGGAGGTGGAGGGGGAGSYTVVNIPFVGNITTWGGNGGNGGQGGVGGQGGPGAGGNGGPSFGMYLTNGAQAQVTSSTFQIGAGGAGGAAAAFGNTSSFGAAGFAGDSGPIHY